MIKICTTLSENGHDVQLVGRKMKSSNQLKDQSFKQHRIPCVFESGKLFYIEYNFKLLFYLLFNSADIYCGIDLDTCIPTLLAAKIKSKKHFYDAHELFPYVPEVIHRKFVQKVWMWVEKIVFKHTHKVYTVSGAIANWFEEKYHKQVYLVRNMPIVYADSVPLNSSKIEYLPEGKFILYQGALNEGRGIELLLEALVGTNYQLVLVGEGDLSEKLREDVKHLGLEQQVCFLGFVVPAELPSITKRAFIGYNVSQNMGLSYYYSLNNKFFDYVGSELPSVINDFPEYTKLLSEYQVGLIAKYTIESVRSQLDTLYQKEDIYSHLKSQCKLAKTKWNWQEESKQLLKLYENHE